MNTMATVLATGQQTTGSSLGGIIVVAILLWMVMSSGKKD
jgi:hypothetical protein